MRWDTFHKYLMFSSRLFLCEYLILLLYPRGFSRAPQILIQCLRSFCIIRNTGLIWWKLWDETFQLFTWKGFAGDWSSSVCVSLTYCYEANLCKSVSPMLLRVKLSGELSSIRVHWKIFTKVGGGFEAVLKILIIWKNYIFYKKTLWISACRNFRIALKSPFKP